MEATTSVRTCLACNAPLIGDEMNLKCGACAVIERKLSQASESFSDIVTEIARLRGQIADLRKELNQSELVATIGKDLLAECYSAWMQMPTEKEREVLYFLENGKRPQKEAQ